MRDRVVYWMRHASPRMRSMHMLAAVVAMVLTFVAFFFMDRIIGTYAATGDISHAFERCKYAAEELQEASDYLTEQARLYVETSERPYVDAYLKELEVTDRRAAAVATLREEGTNAKAIEALENALSHSDELAADELYALRLIAEASKPVRIPSGLADVRLTDEDKELTPVQKRAKAYRMVFDTAYTSQKNKIKAQVDASTLLLMESLRIRLDESSEQLDLYISAMRVDVTLLLLIVAFTIGTTYLFVLKPMAEHEESIRQNKMLMSLGAQELRYLSDAYNEEYEKNLSRTNMLQQEAKIDALTCLLNRGAYEDLLAERVHDVALILIDVDLFKGFNDNYGHEMGDAVLMEVAGTLLASFRSTDHVCRIGGDEFAVIMTNVCSDQRDLVASKVETFAAFLRDTSNGLPEVTVSVGIAFADAMEDGESLFRSADEALYVVKTRGRDGYAFADEA